MRPWMIFTALAMAPLASVPATARPQPEVQQFLQEEITKLMTVPSPTPSDGTHSYMDDYQLAVFRLRIQAQFGFDIGLARVTVVPEAEFFWQ